MTEHPLVIQKSGTRPLLARGFDAFLSVGMWLLYFYMIRRVLADSFLFSEETFSWMFDGTARPFVPEITRFLGTLRIYGAFVLLNSGILIYWALYNQFRFGGLPRPKTDRLVSVDDLARLYRIPAADIVRWQESRISSMRHSADGTLIEVTSGRTGDGWLQQPLPNFRTPAPAID